MAWTKNVPTYRIGMWNNQALSAINRLNSQGIFVALKTTDMPPPAGLTEQIPAEVAHVEALRYAFPDPDYPQVHMTFMYGRARDYPIKPGQVPVYGDPERLMTRFHTAPSDAGIPVRQNSYPFMPGDPGARPGMSISDQVYLATRQNPGAQVGIGPGGEMFFAVPEDKKPIPPLAYAGGLVLLGGILLFIGKRQ